MSERPIEPSEVRFFSGSSNQELAAGIADYLKVPLDPTRKRRFSNDNLYIQLGGSVRSREVFIVQSLSPPVNDHLMELLMMLDISRGAGAKEIHAIVPYFSFGRSDKKDAPRISITARLVADLLATAGATQVMTMMLHSPQVHGFFSLPTDPLSSRPVFQQYFQAMDLEGTIVVVPDLGHVKSASRFAEALNLPLAAAIKHRISDTEVKISGIMGDQCHDCHTALIYDDEIATGGSMVELIQHLVDDGIRRVFAVCTHGVFVRQALERLSQIPEVQEIVTTDTVAIEDPARFPKLRRLSVAHIFGEAIRRNFNRQSIGDLFVYGSDGDEDQSFT
jgi:ribose-phosphate pyrophosphokinase